MRQELSTQVFVPAAFDGGARECTVVECLKDEGDRVTAHDVLVNLRSGQTDVEVESPFTGTIVRLYARKGSQMRVGERLAAIAAEKEEPEAPPRSAAAEAIADRAWLVVAFALAAPALAWPILWFGVTLVVCVLALCATGAKRIGPADVVVVPVRMLATGLRALRDSVVAVRPVIAGAARLVAWALIAIAVPAIIGGVAWLVSEGSVGVLAAVRLAVHGYALPLFGLLASSFFLRAAFRHAGAPALLARVSNRLTEIALLGAALACVGVIVVCAAALGRHSWSPASSFRAAVHGLPHALRDEGESARSSIAEAEARSVVECVGSHDHGGWRRPRAFILENGSLLVGVRTKQNRQISASSLAVLMLALQNQLAPHGVTISIVPRRRDKSNIQFETLETDRPVTDVGKLIDRTALPSSLAPLLERTGPARKADTDIALKCSAAAI